MSEMAPIQRQDTQRLQEFQHLQTAQVTEAQRGELPPVGLDSDRVSLNAKFSSYSAFAQAYPKMHKAMMMSLAQSVLADMRRHEATMKRLSREARQNG